MALIHVSGADPYCATCHGSGVKPFMGYGTTCPCTVNHEEDEFWKALIEKHVQQKKDKK